MHKYVYMSNEMGGAVVYKQKCFTCMHMTPFCLRYRLRHTYELCPNSSPIEGSLDNATSIRNRLLGRCFVLLGISKVKGAVR